jgi:hypothetical protein
MQTLIGLVDIATIPGGKELLTAYGPRGITREAGKPLDEKRLITVGAAKPGTWRATRATALALVEADKAWTAKTGKRIRLLDAARDASVQGAGRMKYEAWVAAGKPQPGTSQFNANTMKAAFVGQVNESNHQWGAANDWDVHSMCANDAELSMLWEAIDDFGFAPIIGKPSLEMSECWHFDHLGPLAAVRDGFRRQPETKHNSYTLTAEVGCLLAATWYGRDNMAKYTQARLMLAACTAAGAGDGSFYRMPGVIDGVLGTKTIACANALGLDVQPGARADQILNKLDEKQLGYDAIARA